MAGHTQLKFIMTECSKTQIRLMRHIWITWHLLKMFSNFIKAVHIPQRYILPQIPLTWLILSPRLRILAGRINLLSRTGFCPFDHSETFKKEHKKAQDRTQGGGGGWGMGEEGDANVPPGRMRTHLPCWANYFKIMQFSPVTEFTPLVLASKSEFSCDSHPLCKNP